MTEQFSGDLETGSGNNGFLEQGFELRHQTLNRSMSFYRTETGWSRSSIDWRTMEILPSRLLREIKLPITRRSRKVEDLDKVNHFSQPSDGVALYEERNVNCPQKSWLQLKFQGPLIPGKIRQFSVLTEVAGIRDVTREDRLRRREKKDSEASVEYAEWMVYQVPNHFRARLEMMLTLPSWFRTEPYEGVKLDLLNCFRVYHPPKDDSMDVSDVNVELTNTLRQSGQIRVIQFQNEVVFCLNVENPPLGVYTIGWKAPTEAELDEMYSDR